MRFHLRWLDVHELCSSYTYQERAKKVKSTEVDNGSDGAATTPVFIRITLGIVKTIQHYFMPVLACGCSAITQTINKGKGHHTSQIND